MISDQLLECIRCPETHLPLRRAEPALLDALNAAIQLRKIRDKAGQLLTEPLEAGLVRQDGKSLYPVIDSIPNMLLDESIPLDQLGLP